MRLRKLNLRLILLGCTLMALVDMFRLSPKELLRFGLLSTSFFVYSFAAVGRSNCCWLTALGLFSRDVRDLHCSVHVMPPCTKTEIDIVVSGPVCARSWHGLALCYL